MEKSQSDQNKEIEEFWVSLFSSVLRQYLDAKEVKIVRPDKNLPEHQRPDVLYEILYENNEKDWTWAEVTAVYPDEKAAEHVNHAARYGRRDTPEQQEALKATVKEALGGFSDESEVNPDHQTMVNWVEITGEGDMPGQQGFLDAISVVLKEPPVPDPDPKIARRCNESILKKMQKESYGHLCKKYGKGHLLVVIPYQTYPLGSVNTVKHVESILDSDLLKQQCNFDSLWIAHKQPERNDLIIYHDPNLKPDSLRYAFYSLWPECNDYILGKLPSDDAV